MSRNSMPQPRDRAEYDGALWYASPNVCPRCKSSCRVLLTILTKKVRAIECESCYWYGHIPKK